MYLSILEKLLGLLTTLLFIAQIVTLHRTAAVDNRLYFLGTSVLFRQLFSGAERLAQP